MRLVFVGASPLAVATVKLAIDAGHEAVLIDKNKDKLDRLSDQVDCGFVHDDGSRPAVLKEVGAEGTDLLLCLSNDDQDNIIASLVGRALGFRRVVTMIEDADYEPICHELGLDDPIVPSRRIAENLVDLAEGRETAELKTLLRGGLRFFSFVVDDAHAGPLSDVEFGCKAHVVAVTAQDRSVLPDGDTTLGPGDEVALIVHQDDIAALAERFHPREE
jgi:trk system potassium uptake protein TrkA